MNAQLGIILYPFISHTPLLWRKVPHADTLLPKRLLFIDWTFQNKAPVSKRRVCFPFRPQSNIIIYAHASGTESILLMFILTVLQYWFFFVVMAIKANVRWLKEVCLRLMTYEIQLTGTKKKKTTVWQLISADIPDRTRRLLLITSV
jgi:1-acyl-sn-glycerol-3-phosphate acyltransferase